MKSAKNHRMDGGQKKDTTLRRRIMSLLREREMDARGLSEELRIKEKEVYEHLVHFERSVAAAGGRFILTPGECLLCGYVFEDRRRLTRPGRCPKCRRSKIMNPSFRIACESDGA
jgi:transcriptional regulator